MNGMMVSLLIVAMTGTVVGQQATSTQFGGNDFGSNSDMSRFIAPFTLPITTQQIQGLMNGEGKALSSRIQPSDPQSNKALPLDVVDEIILFHEPNGDRSLPKVILTPEKGTDGVLRFALTQQDLNDLQSKNFTYRLPANERGLFNRVECYFIDENSGNTPTPDDGTSSTRIKFGPTGNTGQTRFGQQNTRPFQIGLPGPEPGDDDFMGPVAPPQFTNNPNTPEKWSPNNQNGNVNPAFQNANKDPWNIPQKTETPMERLRRQQAELVAQRQQQKEIDDAVAARELATQRQNEIRDAIARQQQQNALNNRPATQNNPNQFTPLQPTPGQNNLVNWEQQLLAKQNEDKAFELAQIQQQLLEKQALIKKQEDELNFKKYLDSIRTNPIARNPVDTTPIRTTPNYDQPLPPRDSQQVRTGTNIFTGPVVEPGNSNFERVSRRTMSPDLSAPSPQRRLASSSTPAGTRSGVPPLSINGKNPTSNSNGAGTRTIVNDRDRKTENFIYFMLLCSLGLNFYLAWISRGFYVRYHELADELRETFTSTT